LFFWFGCTLGTYNLTSRQFTALDTHIGYNFPWSPNNLIPIFGGAQHHDYHHVHRKTNFASNLIIWDKFFGTEGKDWDKTEKIKD
jgi:sterol desaturase/sphingolipid hydroxylase (fatty acid hydroxylase superfamily)